MVQQGRQRRTSVSAQLQQAMTLLPVGGLAAALFMQAAGCDSGEQTVRIVAEDFRFTPSEVRLSAERPIRLIIINEGREPHEFKSALLAHQTSMTNGVPTSLPVLPNHSVETVIRTIPGVYLFYCAMRGHLGMSGTIVVE
jgi:plastocyanin